MRFNDKATSKKPYFELLLEHKITYIELVIHYYDVKKKPSSWLARELVKHYSFSFKAIEYSKKIAPILKSIEDGTEAEVRLLLKNCQSRKKYKNILKAIKYKVLDSIKKDIAKSGHSENSTTLAFEHHYEIEKLMKAILGYVSVK